MSKRFRELVAILSGLSILLAPALVFASAAPSLTQTINPGTLTTNILQSDGVTPVSSPSVSFPATGFSFSCQTKTATLGDTNNRIYVSNPSDAAVVNGWTLTMAATSGNTSKWDDGATHQYAFNNNAGSGCTSGQMTVDPSASTLTLDCSSACTSTGVTKGSSTAYVSGTTDNVTLLTSTNTSPWQGYLTGVGLSQKIPAAQHSGSYSLNMTITVTAN